MGNDSISKTFGVALALCVVCAVVVSSAAVILRPTQEVNKLLADPVFRKRVTEMGLTVMGGTPEDVTVFIASESKRWSEVVKAAGIKVD